MQGVGRVFLRHLEPLGLSEGCQINIPSKSISSLSLLMRRTVASNRKEKNTGGKGPEVVKELRFTLLRFYKSL